MKHPKFKPGDVVWFIIGGGRIAGAIVLALHTDIEGTTCVLSGGFSNRNEDSLYTSFYEAFRQLTNKPPLT